MTLKPSVNDAFAGNSGDYYRFVVAVAKRAREIADSAEQSGGIVDEKPVKLAVEEFVRRKK